MGESEMNDPDDHTKTNKNTCNGNSKVSIAPSIRESRIIELPEPKQQESHKTKPYTLINNAKTNPILKYFFRKLPNFPKSINLFILQKCNR
jgi:hypothetical protein